MAKKAYYLGKEKSKVKIDNRRIEPGEVVKEPAELVEWLLLRNDFSAEDPEKSKGKKGKGE